MKAHALFRLVLIPFLSFAFGAVAEDKPAAKDKAPAADEAEAMKKYEAASTPGAAHKALEPLAGEWNIVNRMWMSPDAPPTETKGKTKTSWIFGGRFLQDDFEGEFMGKPFKGIGFTGYDNLKKKYTNFWIDEGGTGMFTCMGKVSKDGKTFTFTGKMDDPMTGELNKPLKIVIKIKSHDQHTFEMFDLSGGKSKKCMEMVYTRK